jgi:hypothetical protein
MKEFQVHQKPFDFDLKLKECFADMLRDCGKSRNWSRDQIAKALSERLGRYVSKGMINDFAASSHTGARFPAAWVPAFCEVTGSDRLQRMLLSEELRTCLELGEKAAVLIQRHAKSENRA